MTKQENIKLAEVSTDIKWLCQKMEEVNTHLHSLNGAILTDAVKIAENRKATECIIHSVNRQWTVIGIVLSALFALKFTGVL